MLQETDRCRLADVGMHAENLYVLSLASFARRVLHFGLQEAACWSFLCAAADMGPVVRTQGVLGSYTRSLGCVAAWRRPQRLGM